MQGGTLGAQSTKVGRVARVALDIYYFALLTSDNNAATYTAITAGTFRLFNQACFSFNFK